VTDGIKRLETLIHQSEIRHRVLASNIANVDTPNYQSRDVTFGQVLGNEMNMATTNKGHIAAPAASVDPSSSSVDSQQWADKNNVEMDVEVAKMTENAMFFEAGVTLLTKRIQMFKNALKTT
jgi:flagellar basal-body rod protein FlgB